MKLERQFVVVTALSILLVTLMAGPLVAAINITEPADDPVDLYTSFGGDKEGVSIDQELFVSPQQVPTANLSLEETDDDSYQLTIPDALVYVESGSEPVTVTYRVSVPELNYSKSATSSVTAETKQAVPLSISDKSVERPDNSSVEATVTVTAESNDVAFTVTEETVTLEVPQ